MTIWPCIWLYTLLVIRHPFFAVVSLQFGYVASWDDIIPVQWSLTEAPLTTLDVCRWMLTHLLLIHMNNKLDKKTHFSKYTTFIWWGCPPPPPPPPSRAGAEIDVFPQWTQSEPLSHEISCVCWCYTWAIAAGQIKWDPQEMKSFDGGKPAEQTLRKSNHSLTWRSKKKIK